MRNEQYVCENCGYNMVGYYPERCPFCGAPREMIIAMEECMKKYSVREEKITDTISGLRSRPELGYEHSAYRLETSGPAVMIDCPSSFDRNLSRVDVNLFTHHHFLGASNLYRELFNSRVHIHEQDSNHDLCRGFVFDTGFTENFDLHGIEAFHINGHTPGFTCYIFENALFVCDYVFAKKDGVPHTFNPYGHGRLTLDGARMMRSIIEERDIEWVCGQDYVGRYSSWKPAFDMLIENA